MYRHRTRTRSPRTHSHTQRAKRIGSGAVRSRRRAERRCPMCICFIEHATMELPRLLRRQIRRGGGRPPDLASSARQPGDIQYRRYLYPTCVNISSSRRGSLMSNTLRSAAPRCRLATSEERKEIGSRSWDSSRERGVADDDSFRMPNIEPATPRFSGSREKFGLPRVQISFLR